METYKKNKTNLDSSKKTLKNILAFSSSFYYIFLEIIEEMFNVDNTDIPIQT